MGWWANGVQVWQLEVGVCAEVCGDVRVFGLGVCVCGCGLALLTFFFSHCYPFLSVQSLSLSFFSLSSFFFSRFLLENCLSILAVSGPG